MSKTLDAIFKELNIVEKGVKASFSIEGEDFWIVKSKGLFRTQTIARSLLDVCERDRLGVIAGKYDSLVDQLKALTFYQPSGEGVEGGLSLGDSYDEIMKEISDKDPMKAMDIHTDIPYGMAVACLGKPLLLQMMPELEDSTQESSEEISEENSNETEANLEAESEKISNSRAQGFTVAAKRTG